MNPNCHFLHTLNQLGLTCGGKYSMISQADLRYAETTTLMAESEELKSLLKVKEETKKMA